MGILRASATTAGAALVAAIVALPVPARAASEVTFGAPAAAARYGHDVRFTQPVDLPARPKRVEILITLPGAPGPVVADETGQASTGARTLVHALQPEPGELLPNTTIGARWRIVAADGSTSVGPSVSVTYADDRFAWRTEAGPIVRIHWYEGDDAFGRRALAIAEKGVANAEQLLGVKEAEPIDFFVYADQQAFYDALGPATRENVGGEAVPEIRTLFALITPAELDASWVGVVIPHELTHLVFDTAVRNPYHSPPRWLNEGVAVYLSQGYVSSDRAMVEEAAPTGGLMPLTALTGQFPTTRQRFFLAYAESVSAVDFLIRHDGRDALVRLIRTYADGVTDDEAFRTALGLDVAGFQAAWLADVGGRAPARVGPRPAPPGPVPSGWSVAGGTAGAVPGSGGAAVGSQPIATGDETPGAAAPGGPPPIVLGIAVAAVIAAAAAAGVAVRRRRRAGSPWSRDGGAR